MEKMLSPQAFLEATRIKFQQAMESLRPFFAAFQVTSGCNLRCAFCGSDSREPAEDELTTEEVYALLRNLKRAGVAYLSLGGGEPTLREDLPDIVAAASSMMGVGMVTNGSLLDAAYARRLREAGLSVIDISLDGATAAANDPLRGEGTYDRALRAIESAKKAGIPSIDLQTTMSQANDGELSAMIRLALELDVNLVVNGLLPFGRAAGRMDLLLTRDRRREMQRYLLQQQRFLGKQKIKFDGYYIIAEDERAQRRWAAPERRDFSVGDPFGIYGFHITSTGKVVPTMGIEVGDLRRQELQEIWSDAEPLLALRDRDRLKGKCGRCEYRFVCGGDRRRTHALTGDPLAEDPLCWVEPALAGAVAHLPPGHPKP